MIASQLSGHCDVVRNRLWRHQQNENRASETRGRWENIVIFIVICGFATSWKNWNSVHTLMTNCFCAHSSVISEIKKIKSVSLFSHRTIKSFRVLKHHMSQTVFIRNLIDGCYFYKCQQKIVCIFTLKYLIAMPPLNTRGHIHQHDSILSPAWVSDYIHYKMWNDITYPFPNFIGTTKQKQHMDYGTMQQHHRDVTTCVIA